jgi:serine/threonine protein kinase
MMNIKAAVSDILKSFDDLYPADFLKKYDQIELLAESHGTETFLVQQKDNEQFYVAKCYNKDLYAAVHEGNILKSLSHNGLPAYVDEFQNDNVVCIVREYVVGKPLDQYIIENTLSYNEIADICIQLCDILIYLHGQEQPVIHRDIKPQNIIVKPDGKISLIDFDIARIYHSDTKSDTQFIGTREYAPPEQYGFSQTDARTDIYSMGVVLGWLLTYETDVKGSHRKAIHNRLVSIYKKCTAFSPEHRFESAKKLKAAVIRSDGKQKATVLRSIAFFLLCFLFLCAGFVLGRFTGLLEANSKPDTGIVFEEPMIEQAVRLQLGKTVDEPLKQDELLSVYKLYIFGDSLVAKSEEELQTEVRELFDNNNMKVGPIKTLIDLLKTPNLEEVYISMQKITDISPLASLQKLETVSIKNNPITDISPLSELKFLKRISLFDTRVTDLSPLFNCPMLFELDAGKLPIRSLEAFHGLKGLQNLSLYETTIDTLTGMNKLTQLKFFEVSGVIDGDLTPMLSLTHLKNVVLGEDMRQAVKTIEREANFSISYR